MLHNFLKGPQIIVGMRLCSWVYCSMRLSSASSVMVLYVLYGDGFIIVGEGFVHPFRVFPWFKDRAFMAFRKKNPIAF